MYLIFFFFSSRRRHTRCLSDWSSDVCSSDLRGTRTSGSIARADRRPAYAAIVPPSCKIGRASCREECRSRWSPYYLKKKRNREASRETDGENRNGLAEPRARI